MTEIVVATVRTLILGYLKTVTPEEINELNRGVWDIFQKVRDERIKHYPASPRQIEIHNRRLEELGLN